MTILYTVGPGNELVVSKANEDGSLQEQVQVVEQVVDPILPNGLDVSREKGGMKFATEWVSHHPKFHLVFTLTSFWDRAEAMLTTFRVDASTGKLTKLASCPTGGHQACQGIFHPSGNTYVVSHHEDGKVCFFDTSQDVAPEKPVAVIQIPIQVPGSPLPPKGCCHGSSYGPGMVPKYVLAAGSMQDIIMTYPCDEQGRPIPKKKSDSQKEDAETTETVAYESSMVSCKFSSSTGWVQSFVIGMLLIGKAHRPRRVVVHPNGKYMYVLAEFVNAIQVFSIDENGTVNPKFLQELKITKADGPDAWWVGPGCTISAEMQATDKGLIVSVRGSKLPYLGNCESGIYFVNYAAGNTTNDGNNNITNDGNNNDNNDNAYGSRLELGSVISIPGFIRHFWKDDNNNDDDDATLWVGVEGSGTVQKYKLVNDEQQKQPQGTHTAQLVGQFVVEKRNVMCIATKPV